MPRTRPGDMHEQHALNAPDLMVVVAYGLILPQEVLDLPRFGCINIHASLLPRWRGTPLPVQLLYPNPPSPPARLRYFIEAMRASMAEPLWPDAAILPA